MKVYDEFGVLTQMVGDKPESDDPQISINQLKGKVLITIHEISNYLVFEFTFSNRDEIKMHYLSFNFIYF